MNANSSSVSSALLGLAATSFLGLVGYGVVQSQDYEPSPLSTGKGSLEILEPTTSFTISADPTVDVLWVQISGGLSGEIWTYQLYGDGRLVQAWGPEASVQKEVYLEYGEAMDLITLAVEGRLMEWDWVRVEQKLLDSIGAVPIRTDPVHVEVRVSLESYSDAPEGASLPITKTMSAWSVSSIRLEAPHIREIAALDDLIRTLPLYF